MEMKVKENSEKIDKTMRSDDAECFILDWWVKSYELSLDNLKLIFKNFQVKMVFVLFYYEILEYLSIGNVNFCF